jgi:DNA-binding NtrC family response regulator
MERIEAQARLAAQIRTPVWIVGEPGTGKETLGRVIHFNGITAEQTFLCLDCLALQPYLLRNMLFGHLGQTGAQLGTLFVKDPSSMSRDLQEELLNWFDEQDDPPRVIVASRDCTGEDIRSGRILPQFHSTLNVLEIRLPPLRERIADLPALASEFIRGETKSPEAAAELTQDAFDVLNRHSWPGNLRELKAVLGDALESAKGGRIDASHLPLFLRAKTPAAPRASLNLDEVLEAVEARMIRLALQKTRGNKSEAADLLGIPRARLWRRIETLKIEGFQLE